MGAAAVAPHPLTGAAVAGEQHAPAERLMLNESAQVGRSASSLFPGLSCACCTREPAAAKGKAEANSTPLCLLLAGPWRKHKLGVVFSFFVSFFFFPVLTGTKTHQKDEQQQEGNVI